MNKIMTIGAFAGTSFVVIIFWLILYNANNPEFFENVVLNPSKEKNKSITYQVQFISTQPEGVDGKYFVKKNNTWFLYAMLQNQPYWMDVAKTEYKDGAIFKQIPDITHIAIQYIAKEGYKITNVTGEGNFTTSFDIDGDKKNDFVLMKEIEWDTSEPRVKKEFRTKTIIGHVDVETIKPPMKSVKMDIEKIILITKNYPDLLTDEEVDILLSYTIGTAYGFVDPEVDQKAMEIMFKLIGEEFYE